MGLKEAYQEKLEAQLKEWSAQIDQLRAKAEKATATAKIEYHEQIEALRTKQAAARQKLQELREAGEGAWENLKVGVERAWGELKNAVESALAKFK